MLPMWKTGSDHDHREIDVNREKLLAAIFYGASSLAVIFTNKSILTEFDFPYFNFLATVQFVATTIILSILIYMRKVEVPMISYEVCKEVLPISLMFLGNIICGLGSTKSLNLPMFTALRRFSILMTMLAECTLLGSRPSSPIILSILMMVGGALIAAANDLSFDWAGYNLVFWNNVFTAMNGVWLKKASQSGRCSKLGVLFYNSLFSGTIMIVYLLLEHWFFVGAATGKLDKLYEFTSQFMDLEVWGLKHAVPAAASSAVAMSTLSNVYTFPGWTNFQFLFMFVLAASMGSILNYSIFLCTTINSALTTAVVGALKNVLTAYIGMVTFSDYSFSWVNFVGINISIIGSLYYTYMTIFKGVAGFGAG